MRHAIQRVPFRVIRYHWTVEQDGNGVSGWSLTKWGALRAMRRVSLIQRRERAA